MIPCAGKSSSRLSLRGLLPELAVTVAMLTRLLAS